MDLEQKCDDFWCAGLRLVVYMMYFAVVRRGGLPNSKGSFASLLPSWFAPPPSKKILFGASVRVQGA